MEGRLSSHVFVYSPSTESGQGTWGGESVLWTHPRLWSRVPWGLQGALRGARAEAPTAPFSALPAGRVPVLLPGSSGVPGKLRPLCNLKPWSPGPPPPAPDASLCPGWGAPGGLDPGGGVSARSLGRTWPPATSPAPATALKYLPHSSFPSNSKTSSSGVGGWGVESNWGFSPEPEAGRAVAPPPPPPGGSLPCGSSRLEGARIQLFVFPAPCNCIQ